MNFILGNWAKYYTKEVCKTLKFVLIGCSVITVVAVIKYKPVYAVTLSGKTIGYVADKEKTEKKLDNYINDKEGNIAFRIANDMPEYNVVLVSRDQETNENQVLMAVEDTILTTYTRYAITLDGEKKAEVSSEAEAMQVIEEIKSGINEKIDMKLGIVTEYTNDAEIASKDIALASLNEIKAEKLNAYETKKKEEAIAAKKRAIASTIQVAATGSISGLQLSIPVNGSISSRFGSRSSSRSTIHTGIDICTSLGTGVRAIAPGTVTYAGYKGSYGNLVIIDHGNGIESYYAHCNELFVGVGATVDSNTTISSVGSTGNSTGPHLHLEIRINGEPVNPQQYLY